MIIFNWRNLAKGRKGKVTKAAFQSIYYNVLDSDHQFALEIRRGEDDATEVLSIRLTLKELIRLQQDATNAIQILKYQIGSGV